MKKYIYLLIFALTLGVGTSNAQMWEALMEEDTGTATVGEVSPVVQTINDIYILVHAEEGIPDRNCAPGQHDLVQHVPYYTTSVYETPLYYVNGYTLDDWSNVTTNAITNDATVISNTYVDTYGNMQLISTNTQVYQRE